MTSDQPRSAAARLDVTRLPRRVVEAPQAREVLLPALPPAPEQGEHAGYLFGALGSVGLVGVMVIGSHGRQLVITAAAAMLTLGGVVAAGIFGRRRQRARSDQRCVRWLARAGERIAEVDAAAAAQRRQLDAIHPSGFPELAARAAGAAGLWERGTADLDRMSVRVGSAAAPARVRLAVDGPDAGLDAPDAACAAVAVEARQRTATVLGCAVAVDLLTEPLALVGPRERCLEVARWIVAELAVARPPHELAVAVLMTDLESSGAWSWLRFLPHAHDPAVPDGTASLVAADFTEMRALLAAVRTETLLIVDHTAAQQQPMMPEQVASDSAVVWLATESRLVPAAITRRLDLTDGRVRLVPGPVGDLTTVSALTTRTAEEVARALAPLSVAGARIAGADGVGAGLAGLLGRADLTGFDALVSWQERSAADLLRLPLGRDDAGSAVWLDLKESAAAGSGPHGLVVGATGSGKSEVLRSIVAGLVARHSPRDLALLLVDFKGGAAFDAFRELPHVAGLVTNLADDLALVERICQSLDGEMEARQTLLRAAGADSVASLRQRGALAPPSLLVVVDEFGELLTACPDALDVLLRVGRLGRSLGIHLVLASQRLEEGRLRGLDAHLRWRLCLRTFTTAESIAVLGAPAAAGLQPVPGAAWLAVDGEMTRLLVAHSGAPAHATTASPVPKVRPLVLRPPDAPIQPGADSAKARSERDAIVAAALAAGPDSVEPVWLPPLPAEITVSDLENPAAAGLLDLPRRRRQEAFVLDPFGSGPVAIVGAPGSGVSGGLGALAVAALASGQLRRTAVLAFGGDGLDLLAGRTEVAAWADPSDVEHAVAVLEAAEMLALRGESPLRGPLLLVVDGLARARDLVEDLDARLTRIAAAAGSGAVALIVGANRWGDFRGGLRDLIPARIELRLADAADSQHGRIAAVALRSAPPGRGLGPGGEHLQFARLATHHQPLAAAAFSGRVLHPLPPVVAAGRPDDGGLGVRAGDLTPVQWSPRSGHLLVVGDRRSGRSGALGRIVRGRRVRSVLLVDPRRSHSCERGGSGVTWTAGGSDSADAIGRLAAELTARLPGGQLRAAAPLEGAPGEWLVVVDDADLLPAATVTALAALSLLLRHGIDIGFALVLARPVTGWSRAAYEPVLQALRDSGPSALLLSGDPAEGPIMSGIRARRSPPGRGQWIPSDGAPVAVQLYREDRPGSEVDRADTGRAMPPQWRQGAA